MMFRELIFCHNPSVIICTFLCTRMFWSMQWCNRKHLQDIKYISLSCVHDKIEEFDDFLFWIKYRCGCTYQILPKVIPGCSHLYPLSTSSIHIVNINEVCNAFCAEDGNHTRTFSSLIQTFCAVEQTSSVKLTRVYINNRNVYLYQTRLRNISNIFLPMCEFCTLLIERNLCCGE